MKVLKTIFSWPSLLVLMALSGSLAYYQIAVATRDPETQKMNLCHKTSSPTNPWEAVSVSVNANNHFDHHDDYTYAGPTKENGQPVNKPDSDQWCEDNVPPTPIDETPTPPIEETPEPEDDDFVAPPMRPQPHGNFKG